mmetsp:Transcript_95941/g.271256  ORF Transcript_95941/g.271256 Transcript_95941/m.271256 type:complete len:321 (-) Transcript_95941:157-1119(-)
MIALRNIPQKQLSIGVRIHSNGVDCHLSHVDGADPSKNSVVLGLVQLCTGQDVELITVSLRQHATHSLQEPACRHGREGVDPLLRGLHRRVRRGLHLLRPGVRLPGPAPEADELEGLLGRHVRAQRPLQRSLREGQVPAQGARGVDEERRVKALDLGQQRPLGLQHGALELLEDLVRLRQHHVDVVALRHALGQETPEPTHRCLEEVQVLLGLVDLGLNLPLEAEQVGLGDVVMHGHRRARVRAAGRLRPHENRNKGSGGLEKTRSNKLLDGGHVLWLGDEILLEVRVDKLPQLRREGLDEPVAIVRAGSRHGLVGVVHV